MNNRNKSRIEFICNLIPEGDQAVWDLCCDHGLLGKQLLQKEKRGKVHFVDCVPSIMNKLEDELSLMSFDSKERFKCHTRDAHGVQLEGAHDTVAICGVGGQLAKSLVKSILEVNKDFCGSFIISAHYHMYDLRKSLSQLGLMLESEYIINDNSRFYEVIHVSFQGEKVISPTGSEMWNFQREIDCEYFRKLISHYERKAHSSKSAKKIMNDYLDLKEKVLP